MEDFYRLLALTSLGLYYVLVAGVTLRIVIKRRAVSVSLAWLMIIYILPVFGVIIYVLFGELNLGRKRAERANNMYNSYGHWFNQLHDCEAHVPEQMHTDIAHIDDLCTNRMGIPALGFNQLSLLTTPKEILDSIIQDINQATTHIRMEFYIWHPGGMANDVAVALMRAATRGVKVDLLLDSAGSHVFFRSDWVEKMTTQGINVVQALHVNPMRAFLRRLDLRQHRKIIVIDDLVAYSGSMNMVDPAHFKQGAGVGEWVDIMVRIIGPTVNVLSAIHAWDWEVETGKQQLPNHPACRTGENAPLQPVQVVPSGPGMPDNLILQVLSIAISRANESVTITTPYFVPSEELLEVLRTVAQRGVKVRLVIPQKNDSVMVQWASRAYYAELLSAGVEIFEFHGGLLHTKSVVIDDKYCLVGTVNLDMRSLWLNFEVTLVIEDGSFTNELVTLLDSYIAQSNQLTLEQWEKRNFMSRFLERAFFLFSPLL